jgi:hypothetical protein
MSHLIFAKTIGRYSVKQDRSKNGMSVTLSYTVIQKPSGSTNINFLTNWTVTTIIPISAMCMWIQSQEEARFIVEEHDSSVRQYPVTLRLWVCTLNYTIDYTNLMQS